MMDIIFHFFFLPETDHFSILFRPLLVQRDENILKNLPKMNDW